MKINSNTPNNAAMHALACCESIPTYPPVSSFKFLVNYNPYQLFRYDPIMENQTSLVQILLYPFIFAYKRSNTFKNEFYS